MTSLVEAGSSVGRFLLTRQLGVGGFAEVWEGDDQQLRRKVAVKIALPAICEEQEFVARFLREARIAASLDHPSILQVYDVGTHQGRPYFVMPVVPGGRLSDRMSPPPPVADLIRSASWPPRSTMPTKTASSTATSNRRTRFSTEKAGSCRPTSGSLGVSMEESRAGDKIRGSSLMPRYVAFLRALNVGGHTVKMDALRFLFESLEFSRVETFITSGNVIFETRSTALTGLEERIEEHLRAALRYDVAVFLRTDSDVAAIASYIPFPGVVSFGALNVALLKAPLRADLQQAVMGFKSPIDDFHVHGSEVYWACSRKQSDSAFSNAVFEKALGLRTTFRGMNTMIRLAARLPVISPDA